MSITGAEGLPGLENAGSATASVFATPSRLQVLTLAAGNVLRPSTSLKLSLRLPPTVDAKAAAEKLKAFLEEVRPSPPLEA